VTAITRLIAVGPPVRSASAQRGWATRPLVPAGELFAFGAVLSLQIGSLFNQLGAQSFTGAVAVLGDRAAGGTGGTVTIIAGAGSAVAARPPRCPTCSPTTTARWALPRTGPPAPHTGVARQYQQTFQATVIPMATANRAVTKAIVRGAGLIDSSADQARCLVFGRPAARLGRASAGPEVPAGRMPESRTSVPTKVTQNA